MSKNQSKYRLRDLISNDHWQCFQELALSLEYVDGDDPYLAIIDSDSPRLKRLFQQELLDRFPGFSTFRFGSLQAENLGRHFSSWKRSGRPVLLDLFGMPAKKADHLIAQLMLYRDEIARLPLQLILLVNPEFRQSMHRKAYDLISCASYSCSLKGRTATI